LNAETFPNHLRTLRLANGIRQIDAAKAAGVNVSTWCCWERGSKTPRLLRGQAIAEALNVPIAALFRDDLVLEVVLSPATVEEVRRDGREGARSAAQRLAAQLEPSIFELATRKPVDVRAGARPKPRRTRVEKLAGVEEANAMRKAALERRRQPAVAAVS
jgi:transcriptional regulator with XRE-family HTH domain